MSLDGMAIRQPGVRASNLSRLRELTTQLVEREQEIDELHRALETAAEGIARLDTKGRFTEVNSRYSELFGRGSAELLHQAWDAHVHPDDRLTVSDALRKALSNVKSRAEVRIINFNGETIWIELTVIASFRHNRFAGYFCLARDITHRKLNEQQLLALKSEILRLSEVHPPGMRPCGDCPLNLRLE